MSSTKTRGKFFESQFAVLRIPIVKKVKRKVTTKTIRRLENNRKVKENLVNLSAKEKTSPTKR